MKDGQDRLYFNLKENKMKKLFAVTVIFALVLTGCGDKTTTDNGEKINGNNKTTLTINNMSSYNLLDVEYSTNFGDINSGKDVTKEVNPGTRYVFFSLSIFDEQIRCRIANVLTCTEGKSNELTVTNSTVVTTTSDDKTHSLKNIVDILTIEMSKPKMTVEQGTKAILNNSLTPVDFGKVDVGTNDSLIFSIKNTGNMVLELTGDPLVESSNSVFSILTQPAKKTINPSDTASFLLRYTPATEGEDTGTISILNSSDEMIFTFAIKGTGYIKRPQITVKQVNTTINPNGEFDFGSTFLSVKKDVIFTIENSGDADLTLETVNDNRINLENNSVSHFTVFSQPSAIAAVPPGSTTTFIIRFDPLAVGNGFTAIVKIKTNSRNNGDFSFTVKGSGVLATPTDVTAVFQQPSSILVSWNPVLGAMDYKVYYGTSSSAITILADNAVTETSYTHTGLSDGTTYYYCIIAQDNVSESARSQAVSMITLPGIPANLRSTASTYNSINLAWGAVTGAVFYRVYYATSAEGSKTLVGENSGTSYAHTTGLSADTTYYYFVSAVNYTGEGAYTEALSVRTLLAPLSAPTNVTATALSTNSIQVEWGAVDGTIGYRVYRATSAGGTRILLNTVTTTSFTNGGLDAVTYWYFITALNADNVESALSASASMIPKPNAPGNVRATGYDYGVLRVSWNSVSGRDSYRIYYATSPTGTKTLAGTTGGVYYLHSGLASNTRYHYWVTAVNAGGESDYSLYTSDASAVP
jgi:fibronectin type 3 domain-containing protein